MLTVMILSLGYLIIRQVLQLMLLALRGDRANEVASAGAPRERLRGALCTHSPAGVPGPGPDLQHPPPARRAGRVPGALQRASPASGPGQRPAGPRHASGADR